MPYIARVTCPSCRTEFQTLVEQILDVRIDPGVKSRLLSGMVNVATCPTCGISAKLNLPFIYHDPNREVALLYLPIEAGRTEVERQRFAGVLTRQLMDSLAPEERKGYLLQPETFISVETMVRRALELEGVSEEEMARSQEQHALLGQFMEAEPETWEALLAEHTDLIDEAFFSLFQYVLEIAFQQVEMQAEAVGEEMPELPPELQRLDDLHAFLTEHHPVGQKLSRRTQAMRQFLDAPGQENLIRAFVAAPDDAAVAMLVEMGLPYMDYRFFQGLLNRMESAETEVERTRLQVLRKQILDLRDELQKASQDQLRERFALLERLLATDDLLKMARSHLSELDNMFVYVLRAEIDQAQESGDRKRFEALGRITKVLNQITEQSLPPEMVLVRHLLMASTDAEVAEYLAQNREALTEPFFEFMSALEERSRQNGELEVANRLAALRTQAQSVAASSATSGAQTGHAMPSRGTGPQSEAGETRTPSGLIIPGHK
ncbi:MAG: hypothetical protein JXB35_08575 [Anaerolineae bacterium]|nr:hypothetical protein [Anaerolineae bacterium]